MSTRKTTLFYFLLTIVASLAVGMVIASRLDLTPTSTAQTMMAAPSVNSAPITGPLDAQTFRNIAKAQTPMVVNIRTETKGRGQDLTEFFGGAPDDLLHRFFGSPDQEQGGGGGSNRRRPREQTTVAAGSGFIISKEGLILTNNHVVDGATKIQVGLFGEDLDQYYDAKLIGHDQLSDTALIQLVEKPSRPLTEARFGDSAQMGPGDWVVAIGNPFNLSHTVTVGVISATQRGISVTDGRQSEMIQTDAAINPGNSGGPLLNLRGEVIGMNTMIVSNSRSEGNLGIGFAVPSNTMRDLLPQLRQGKVSRGRIGIQVAVVPREGYEDFGLKSRAGAVVASVTAGGAAAKAGIEPGDVITEYNGHAVPNRDELVKMVVGTKPGTTVPVKLLRNKQEKTVNVTVDELDLAAETGQGGRNNNNNDQQEEQAGTGFGITLGNLTDQMARRLQVPRGQTGALVTDVDPNGPASPQVRPGDVILSVNRKAVSSAAEAGRELQAVPSGRIAQILLWRGEGEVFVTIRKE